MTTPGESTETETQWGVLWDGLDDGVVEYDKRDRAAYVASLYDRASVVRRTVTVTCTPWVADDC